ncbi:TlpA family protein disulfide reductase [Sphingobacterium sp. LRF_L2]|uniref:TlpA family protein disulfide reductase n=1 Tax=Sphingobacterium sp. LRF_L2 TaxID=3369421 RepID=UPI003F5DDC56
MNVNKKNGKLSTIHLLSLLSLFSFFCYGSSVLAAGKKTTLKGIIKGFESKTVTFSYQSYAVPFDEDKVDIRLDGDGSFTLELSLSAAVRGFVMLGSTPVEERFVLAKGNGVDTTVTASTNRPHIVYFYLSPGDRQQVTVDPQDISGTLLLRGKGSDNSLYLNQEDWRFNQYKDKHLKNYFSYVHYEPGQYLSYVDGRRDERMDFLAEFSSRHAVSKQLLQISKNSIYGDAIMARLLYPRMRESYRKEDYIVPTDYYDFLKDVALDQSDTDKGIAYFYFLDYFLKESVRLEHFKGEVYEFAETKLSGRLLYAYYAFALRSNFKKGLYEKFGQNCPYPILAKRVKTKYSKLEGMLEGNPAPIVDFEDQKGNTFSWEKWKGKYIYVDFWATWCGPCIEEIPALEKLQVDYANKDIVFLSVSFDREKDKQKWLDFLKERSMKGTQLWIDEANKKELSERLNILQIPRFLLLDREGHIVDANAPRPSTAQVRELFDNLL